MIVHTLATIVYSRASHCIFYFYPSYIETALISDNS